MAKYLSKDSAREFSTSEISDSSNLVWFVPHFAVQTVHKPEKMQIVFDAAAEVEGMSLNKALLKGPDNIKCLIAILMQFRLNKIGVTTDTRGMFSQIKVHETDQHAHRFLWRNGDSTQPIRHCYDLLNIWRHIIIMSRIAMLKSTESNFKEQQMLLLNIITWMISS